MCKYLIILFLLPIGLFAQQPLSRADLWKIEQEIIGDEITITRSEDSLRIQFQVLQQQYDAAQNMAYQEFFDILSQVVRFYQKERVVNQSSSVDSSIGAISRDQTIEGDVLITSNEVQRAQAKGLALLYQSNTTFASQSAQLLNTWQRIYTLKNDLELKKALYSQNKQRYDEMNEKYKEGRG